MRMRRRFQNKIGTFWSWLIWALIALVFALCLVSCKTVQSDSLKPLDEFKLSLMDQLLDSLNNVSGFGNGPGFGVIKTRNPRTGKPFTWWQRNISGAGKIKIKNVQINSNNKDKSDNSTTLKAKGSAVANTGDSTTIAAAPQKSVNKGKSTTVEGDGNKVTTKTGGTPWWLWAGLALLGVTIYKYWPLIRKLLPF